MTIDEIRRLRKDAMITSKNLKKSHKPTRSINTVELAKVSDKMVALCDIILGINKKLGDILKLWNQ